MTIEIHFQGKDPTVRRIYDELLKSVGEIGPFAEDPKKTSIHLVRDTALAGIATRKEYLILTLKTDHQLPGMRVQRTEQASAKRFYSEIKLASPRDVDDELKQWLLHAYELSGKR
jgi:hypothetical protein